MFVSFLRMSCPIPDSIARQLPRAVGVGGTMRHALLVAVTAAALLFSAADARAAERGLRIGFFDGVFSSANAAERGAWLGTARAAGSDIVRIDLPWRGTAVRRPRAPRDPADAAYHWAPTDAAVRDATSRGLTVLLTISAAPRWA